MNYKNIHIIALLGSAILFYACNKTETINTNSTQASTNNLLLNSESKEYALLHIEYSLNTHFKNNITGVGDFTGLLQKITIDNGFVTQHSKQQAFNNLYDKIDSLKKSFINDNKLIQFIDLEFSFTNNKTNGGEDEVVAMVHTTAATVPSTVCPESDDFTNYQTAASKLEDKLNDPVCNERVTPFPDINNYKEVSFHHQSGVSFYDDDWVFKGNSQNISKGSMDNYLDRWASEVTDFLQPENSNTGIKIQGYIPQLYTVNYDLLTGKNSSEYVHYGKIKYGFSVYHMPRALLRCC
jgi:hypothetical protein